MTTDAKLDAAILKAAKQLSRSERGRDTLQQLRQLFTTAACSLDSENMIALCVLVEALRVGKYATIIDAIEAQKGTRTYRLIAKHERRLLDANR